MRLRRELQRLRGGNHFELFGLTPAYALDLERLDRAYRDIQARVHPDKFAQAGDAERRASMEMTTRVNEAYRTLKSPVQRAKYLLELNGVDAGFETDTAMPEDFLFEQLELREQLEAAKDAAALDRIQRGLKGERQAIEAGLAEKIDVQRDYPGARIPLRKLMFLQRFGEEVHAAYESLEA